MPFTLPEHSSKEPPKIPVRARDEARRIAANIAKLSLNRTPVY
jgi:hypothetical protein